MYVIFIYQPGLACDEKPEPVCINDGTCRSVHPSATRLAHHVCDCIAPFTGADCSEISTTVSSPTTDSALITYPSTAVGGTTTIVTSKVVSTSQGITSQTNKLSPTVSTILQTGNTTPPDTNSSPVTNGHTLPHKTQTEMLIPNITSQSSSNTTTSSQTTPLQTAASSHTATSSQIITSSTEDSPQTEGNTTVPVHPPSPAQTTRSHDTNSTACYRPPKPTVLDDPFSYRSLILPVTIFALIILIPVAISFYCRMTKKEPKVNLPPDDEMLTQNNKTDFNNKT